VAARLIRAGLFVAILALALAGCGEQASAAPSPTPETSLSGGIALARGQIQTALSAHRIQLASPLTPYRPAETPAFAAAPRALVQAILPQDPTHGYIVIYEFPDVGSASQAGVEEARYVAAGPGRVQFPNGTQFVMRQLGTAIAFYSWVPGSSPDPATPDIATALKTLGSEIPVSS
jgi:hypothetical protein